MGSEMCIRDRTRFTRVLGQRAHHGQAILEALGRAAGLQGLGQELGGGGSSDLPQALEAADPLCDFGGLDRPRRNRNPRSRLETPGFGPGV